MVGTPTLGKNACGRTPALRRHARDDAKRPAQRQGDEIHRFGLRAGELGLMGTTRKSRITREEAAPRSRPHNWAGETTGSRPCAILPTDRALRRAPTGLQEARLMSNGIALKRSAKERDYLEGIRIDVHRVDLGPQHPRSRAGSRPCRGRGANPAVRPAPRRHQSWSSRAKPQHRAHA